jgi:NADH:ubiquinone oxidoreductase subunit D
MLRALVLPWDLKTQTYEIYSELDFSFLLEIEGLF